MRYNPSSQVLLRVPRLILDMRQASPNDPDSAWLFRPTLTRLIGTTADDGGFHLTYRPYELTTYYDVLTFFEQTSLSALLPLS